MLWSAAPLLKLMGIGPSKRSKAELRAKAALAQAMRLKAKYDAAQTTAENAQHWSQSDDLSARAANSLAVRKTLRRRARYEVSNNSYAAGMLLTCANDVVGTGPRLQMQGGEKYQKIERAFAAWAREVRLAQKLRTAVLTRRRDGEVFLRFFTNPALQSPVWLDIEVLEADQVTTPNLVPDKKHIDGITFDDAGNPVSYDILEQHPGDDYARVSLTPEQVPASHVLHWFREDRPGQRRGIPEITPALPLFAQLRRFTLAVITAAETAADHAAILYAGAGTDAEDCDDLPPYEEVQYQRGTLTAVPFGWRMEQMEARQPTTTYGMFKSEILQEISRCLSMPFNVAAGNSSGYNYSSGRLDHQIYFRAIGIEQTDCELVILDKIFRAWYAEASLLDSKDPETGVIGPYVPEIDLTDRPYSWAWDPSEDLDPTKSAAARLINLQAGMLSIPAAYAEMGLDWQVEQQRQAEALGISVDQVRNLIAQKLYGVALSTDPKLDPSGDLLASRRQRRKNGMLSRILRKTLGV